MAQTCLANKCLLPETSPILRYLCTYVPRNPEYFLALFIGIRATVLVKYLIGIFAVLCYLKLVPHLCILYEMLRFIYIDMS